MRQQRDSQSDWLAVWLRASGSLRKGGGMQVLRGNSGSNKLAAAGSDTQVLRGSSGSDKLAAANGGMQVLRGNSGTDK